MTENTSGNRIIQIQQNIISPATPRLKTVKPRKASDFPGVPGVYLEAALKFSNPLLMGPPLCDELVVLIQHMFTEEEANIFCSIGIVSGKTARQIAHETHQPLEAVRPILDCLALSKRFISSSGPENSKKYRMMPLFPGVFEMCLIRPSLDSLTDWHRRFAELFEALYETGYMLDYYRGKPAAFVRYLPLNQVIETHPMALPTDKLEVILDRFKVFGVGICQCRLTEEIMGRGCNKPKLNSATMGEGAEIGIQNGVFKKVTKQEMLEIKLEAEANGLVNWMMNIESAKSQSSCSCCGCCCHNFRIVTEFNTPSAIAPPHFIPKVDFSKCLYCGKCARNCPMGAITIDIKEKKWVHLGERCIGCGLCAVACGKGKALAMEPVPDYKMPYKSWFSLISRSAPNMLKNSWKVWRERKS